KICFVFSNAFSTTASKTVKAKVEYEGLGLEAAIVAVLGLVPTSLGVVFITFYLAIRKKEKAVAQRASAPAHARLVQPLRN
ncbi:MAG: hypothetical protein ACP5KA_07515, partial [Desulfurococcaceae archaeon]